MQMCRTATERVAVLVHPLGQLPPGVEGLDVPAEHRRVAVGRGEVRAHHLARCDLASPFDRHRLLSPAQQRR